MIENAQNNEDQAVELVDSPLKNAYANYNRMRSQGRHTLRGDDLYWYYTYRNYRNASRYWPRAKNRLITVTEASVEAAKNKLSDFQEFETWFAAATVGRGLAEGQLERVSSKVDYVEEIVNLYDDEEGTIENIKDQFDEALQDFNMIRFEGYTEDGFIWYEDENSGEKYFVCLVDLHSPYAPFNVLGKPAPMRRPRALQPWNDLKRSVLNFYPSKVRHPVNFIDDYYGHYQHIGFNDVDKPESVERAFQTLRYYKG